jgi:hypothetical protein
LASDSASADFITTPTFLMMKYSGTVYYPPGWWWGYPGYGWGYPGWGYPGWGYPGYPWYPGYGYSYSYKTGTIVIEMLDADSFLQFADWSQDPTNEVPDLMVRWMGAIDGYLSSSGDYDAQRAQRGMDEAFAQSPYLKK